MTPDPPRQVFLFSGHMVDAPDREKPRFPAQKEPIAAKAIADALAQLGAAGEDLGFSQAAAGGDLLFIEACQRRGVRVQVLLPFPEPDFIKRSPSASAGGDQWRDRYDAARDKLKGPIRIMPGQLGPPAGGVGAYERRSLWVLDSALAWGADKGPFTPPFNGSGGDGAGGAVR